MADPFDIALQQEGVSGSLADLARSIYMQESGGGKNTTTSNAGAVGGMQIIPDTFNRMADQGWDINNPEHNARAGLRYIKRLHEMSGGDPMLTAAGYYGGEGAIDKARRGIAISDPRNPNAPNTLQYGKAVADRLASATMSDANPVGLSSMSNEELLKLAKPSTGLQGMSDQQLLDLTKGQAAPQPEAPMSGGNVAYQAITNIPSSAAKFGGDIYHAVTNPVETVTNMGLLGAGAIKNALPKSVTDFITSISKEPGQINKAVEIANAVGGEYAKKYGSMEGFKTAIATDPVGTAADISMLLTGGGSVAAKLPGMMGRAGETVANVGRAIDPLNIAVNAVTKPARLAEALATPTLGLATGAGAESIREAAKAGAAGGEKAEAFLGQLRGNAPMESVVNTAKEAVSELYKNRSESYLQGMGNVTSNKAVLDFAPIDAAITRAEKVGTFHGIKIRENAADALAAIKSKIDEFKANPATDIRTIKGFDKLKQAISDIQQSQPYGTPARKVADEMYNAVKNEIIKQAPDYAKVMSDYETASALLKDIEGSLSLGKKATVDSSIRKLQSIMRNNANTNYGRRVDLAKELAATGVPGAETLMPQIAGQMLNSYTPRGIQGGVLPGAVGGAALTAAFTNPGFNPNCWWCISQFTTLSRRGGILRRQSRRRNRER